MFQSSYLATYIVVRVLELRQITYLREKWCDHIMTYTTLS